MAGIDFVSYSKFQDDPKLQKEFGSYTNYLVKYTESLSKTSLMTFANNKNLMYSLPQTTRETIWARSKAADAKKAEAEEQYYMSLQAERNANNAKEVALNEYKKMSTNFDDKDLRVTNAHNKFLLAAKNASGAEFNRELLGEHMVSASKLANSAFAQGMIADNMLGFNA